MNGDSKTHVHRVVRVVEVDCGLSLSDHKMIVVLVGNLGVSYFIVYLFHSRFVLVSPRWFRNSRPRDGSDRANIMEKQSDDVVHYFRI